MPRKPSVQTPTTKAAGVTRAPARRTGAARKPQTPAIAADAAEMGAQAPAEAEAANGADVADQEFRRRVAEAAYYFAEQRGFAPGYELEDWLKAEAEVKANGARA